MDELKTSRFDYWTLRFCRDSAAITTFVVAPVYQILETRSLPVFLLISLLFLVVGHGATAFRHLPSPASTIAAWTRNSSPNLKWFLLSYALLTIWMAISLTWSPAPMLGARDTFLFATAPFLAVIFAIEFSKTTLFRFSTILSVGFSISAVLLALELGNVTNLQAYGDLDGAHHDLNRNSGQMVLVFWPVMLVFLCRDLPRVLAIVPVVAVATILIFTESQSAQVAAIASFIVWLSLILLPRLFVLATACSVAMMVGFPFLVTPLVAVTDGIRIAINFQPSAEHRLQLWTGYAEPILDNFIFGYGAKANRVLGIEGKFGEFATRAGFGGNVTHPHNVSLEFWVDFGLVGMLLCASVVLAIISTISKFNPHYKKVAMSLFVAGLVYSFSGASFMQAWWLSAICMATSALVACHLSLKQQKH